MSSQELFLTDFLKECSWELDENQGEAASRDSDWVVDYEGPLWMVRCRYENLTDAAMRALSAWVVRRRKALVTCTVFRPDRRYPLLLPSFSNTGLGISSVTDTTVNLTGISPSSGHISAGDMLSYKTAADGYYVGEVIADVTASSGNAAVLVHPPPQTPHASPVPKLKEAIGEFKLVSRPQLVEVPDRKRGVSFELQQVVRV